MGYDLFAPAEAQPCIIMPCSDGCKFGPKWFTHSNQNLQQMQTPECSETRHMNEVERKAQYRISKSRK